MPCHSDSLHDSCTDEKNEILSGHPEEKASSCHEEQTRVGAPQFLV